MPFTTSERAGSMYHFPDQQQQQQQTMELSIPTYPQAAREQRRKKRSKRRSKQQQQPRRRATSSSSEDAYRRKSTGTAKRLPILEETPQVLLWHSSEETPVEDRNVYHTDTIFRQQAVRRQGPEQDATFEEGEQPTPALLGREGPKWFEWQYWKARLSLRCCFPKQPTQQTREPLVDYRPSFLGRYDDDFYNAYSGPAWGLPDSNSQNYYVIPWPPPQVSPLTEVGMPFDFSPFHKETNADSVETAVGASTQPAAANSIEASKPKRHHRKNSSLLGTHYESPSLEPKNELPPVLDLQSISSLESQDMKTPRQLHSKVVIPDTDSTEKSNGSALSIRNKGVRMGNSRIVSSPRNLPPVPPRRSKHKSQVTNSTMGSTALPPLPSPMSHTSSVNSRDLARSFSEVSANTTGSRHRRGGTVTEFSFESVSRPRASSTRSTSLPVEVQIHVHVPERQEIPSIRMVDSKDSWGATPPRAYFQQNDETPTGYISPLEEEEEQCTRRLTIIDRSPGNRTRANSEAYAADIEDSPETSASRNPQDSLGGDDSILSIDQENDPPPFEQTSPFAKLKEPPAIPAGESWMWSWVNKSTVDTPKAVTPTQSPSSDASSIVETRKLSRQMNIKTEYLPRSADLENSWRSLHAESPSQVFAVSGWVAFGMGESIVKKLTMEGRNLDREDIAHLILPNATEKLWYSKSDGTFDAVDLSGCRVEVHEISRKHGRALYLKRIDSGETVCTLLPVSLPEGFSDDEQLFGDGSICFPSGSYLPDDQQYTSMHIMFSLDALLKARQAVPY